MYVSLEKRALFAVAMAFGLVMAAPLGASASAGAPAVAPLDTVVATGSGGDVNTGAFSDIDITARGGAFGKAPSGNASLVFAQTLRVSGPVTCLSVTGANAGQGTPTSPTTAILNVQDSTSGLLTIQLVDHGGGGSDVIDLADLDRSPSDCGLFDLSVGVIRTLDNGRATVVDTSPLETATMRCSPSGNSFAVTDTFTNLPASQPFLLFQSAEVGGKLSVIDGTPVTTDGTGAGSTPAGYASFARLPVRRGLALYRDTNGNHHWDPGVDESAYRGDGTITSCPQTVTASPK